VQHLVLSYITPVSERTSAVTRSVPVQPTRHDSSYTQTHNSAASTARSERHTAQHTAAPHLHATLATIARDATAAQRTTPCAQPPL
jgi:hypothetical protein